MRKIRIWSVVALLALCLSSCATYGVVKEQLAPAGPALVAAFWQDLSGWLGIPFGYAEGFLGYEGSSEIVPE